nr:4Fe-4S single cluster domain-containing protein [uncultured Undibacterium sp.]
MKLFSHQLQCGIRGLGPGNRVGFWVQGCTVGCAKCCSPETHNRLNGTILTVDHIIHAITSYAASGRKVEGLTVSGGEATEQSAGVLQLIRSFNASFPDADVLLYSGLQWRVIQRDFSDLVEACDVIVSEPFVHKLSTSGSVLIGSSNQTIHLLSERSQVRYPPYLNRPPIIQLHKLGNESGDHALRDNHCIQFTGVPNAIFLGSHHD